MNLIEEIFKAWKTNGFTGLVQIGNEYNVQFGLFILEYEKNLGLTYHNNSNGYFQKLDNFPVFKKTFIERFPDIGKIIEFRENFTDMLNE